MIDVRFGIRYHDVMNPQVLLRLPTKTLTALRARCEEGGVRISELVDLFVRRGLDATTIESIRAWGAAQVAHAPDKGLTRIQARILSDLRGPCGSDWVKAAVVAEHLGLTEKEAESQLCKLQRKGRVQAELAANSSNTVNARSNLLWKTVEAWDALNNAG